MHPSDTPACFAAHLGVWAIEPTFMAQALTAIQRGLWVLRPPYAAMEAAVQPATQLYTATDTGVAIIRISGQMQKFQSKFGGTSTVQTRQAIHQALADPAIQSLLLAIDSPGGMVPGTAELADVVLRASETKPTAAHIEDLGASAAYWVASQAQRITANRMAEIGSIGVFAALVDSSGAAEREGLVVHRIATGPQKGSGMPGTPITPADLADMQARVDTVGQHFFAAVKQGRRLSQPRLDAVTDGRVFPAQQAQALGLIDEITTFEEALVMTAAMPRRRQARREARGARLASLATITTTEE